MAFPSRRSRRRLGKERQWIFDGSFSRKAFIVLVVTLLIVFWSSWSGLDTGNVELSQLGLLFPSTQQSLGTPNPLKRLLPNSTKSEVFSKIEQGRLSEVATNKDDWDAVGIDGQQHFHGFYAMKADGSPVFAPKPYVHYKDEPEKDKELHHTGFSFNKWRSDQLPLSLPRIDQRTKECKELSLSGYYHKLDLPNTSVVMVAYNEPLSTLFRSVHSVLDRTPPDLLHEIILVDDGSTSESFKQDIEEYVALLPKTKLLRLPERKGLMTARTRGAEFATGDTITFLDSHIEALYGWLQPLLARVAINRRNVAMPVIDIIDADTWEYTLGGISILGFSWSLAQIGVSRKAPEDKTEALPSPIMAGGLFTIDRSWFMELGKYDAEMQIWGGEELELSWKIWQCGGRLECLPCSRVGHIFRSSKHWKGRVFSVPDGVILRNKLRAAYVWMDEPQLDIVNKTMGKLPPGMEVGDLSAMKSIRRNLKCKSFQHYLDTVYPELFTPNNKTVTWRGRIRSMETSLCLGADLLQNGKPFRTMPCKETAEGSNQEFMLTNFMEFRVSSLSNEFCLDGNAGTHHAEVIVYQCHGSGGAQKWSYDKLTKRLEVLNYCMTAADNGTVAIEHCNDQRAGQKWDIDS